MKNKRNILAKGSGLVLGTLAVLFAANLETAQAATANFKILADGIDYLSGFANPPAIKTWPIQIVGSKGHPNYPCPNEDCNWRSIFYNLSPFTLDYTYNVVFSVFRNGAWLPLKDVGNAVRPGESVSAFLDVQAEWRGTAGSWMGTPKAYVKDAFDWNGIDGCYEENFSTSLNNDTNRLYAPAIFKKPELSLSGSGFSCQGNTCAALNTPGSYPLTLTAKATEARQHYWQRLDSTKPGAEWMVINPAERKVSCLAVNHYGGNCTKIVDSTDANGNQHWNVGCTAGAGWKRTDPVVESNAAIAEWKTDGLEGRPAPPTVTVGPPECKTGDLYCDTGCAPTDTDCAKCGKDGTCIRNCTPTADPDCACTVGDGICDPGCSPADADCSRCVQDGFCVRNCSPTVDPDCSGVIDAFAIPCSIILEESNPKVCANEPAQAKFRAVFSNTFFEPTGYNWNCGNGSASGNETVTCKYPQEGSYTPTLKMKGKSRISGADGEVNCNALDEAKSYAVSRQAGNCSLEARKTGSDAWTGSELSVYTSDEVEVRVAAKQCLGGNAAWKFTNASSSQSTGTDSAKAKFKVGEGTIGAAIDGIECGGIKVKATEKASWQTGT